MCNRAGGLVPQVSIHALLAECDSRSLQSPPGQGGFNPRTPCGVRLFPHSEQIPVNRFQSTHSLRSATAGKQPVFSRQQFQSTHSLRSATIKSEWPKIFKGVSIHALLAECDIRGGQAGAYPLCFNPRTPCGVRPPNFFNMASSDRFQSTHSLRSATADSPHAPWRIHVSIHALLAECDNL